MLLILGIEQLRRGFADQHGGNGRQDRLGQHVTAVVGQAVNPGGQTIAQVAPDEHAGQEAAQEPHRTDCRSTDSHANQTVGERFGNGAGQAQQGKGQDVVQKNHAHKRQQTGGRRCIKAQQHLQQAVYKAGEQAPLYAVAEGNEDEGQHAEQRNRTAVRQLIDLDVRQYGAQGDHQGALYQGARFGIGFGHG